MKSLGVPSSSDEGREILESMRSPDRSIGWVAEDAVFWALKNQKWAETTEDIEILEAKRPSERKIVFLKTTDLHDTREKIDFWVHHPNILDQWVPVDMKTGWKERTRPGVLVWKVEKEDALAVMGGDQRAKDKAFEAIVGSLILNLRECDEMDEKRRPGVLNEFAQIRADVLTKKNIYRKKSKEG